METASIAPWGGPANENTQSERSSILELLIQRRTFVLVCTAALSTILTLAVFLLPPSYVAQASILPPQQPSSGLAALAGGAMGGIGGVVGSQLGLKNPADLYIGILKSRTVADDIINQFALQRIYRTKHSSDARTILSAHSTFATSKDSLITISFRDSNPQRAAAITNAYITALHKQNSKLALTDASTRRLFYEQQVAQEKDALSRAELALRDMQHSTGLITPAGQTEAMVKSAAQIRAEIASREVELQAARSYATDQNPHLQTLKQEISALRGELHQLESGTNASKYELSADQVPGLGLEYIRRMRDVKYHEALFELLAKQYEAARIDEGKQAPVIQVLDLAAVPDKDSRPRILMTAVSIVAALLFSCMATIAVVRGSELVQTLRIATVSGQ